MSSINNNNITTQIILLNFIYNNQYFSEFIERKIQYLSEFMERKIQYFSEFMERKIQYLSEFMERKI